MSIILITLLELKNAPDDDISLMYEMQVCAFLLNINYSILNVQVRRNKILEL
jgi:hypothetical protein